LEKRRRAGEELGEGMNEENGTSFELRWRRREQENEESKTKRTNNNQTMSLSLVTKHIHLAKLQVDMRQTGHLLLVLCCPIACGF